MKRVLLTGMSATGKSSVIEALRAKGYPALDMDDPGWSMVDADGSQKWCEECLWDWFAAQEGDLLFVAGCAENQVAFYPVLNYIILLSAPRDVIMQRLAARTNNSYGKRPEELAEVLHYMETVEPLLRRSATHEIDTTVPLEQVVSTILAHVNEEI